MVVYSARGIECFRVVYDEAEVILRIYEIEDA